MLGRLTAVSVDAVETSTGRTASRLYVGISEVDLAAGSHVSGCTTAGLRSGEGRRRPSVATGLFGASRIVELGDVVESDSRWHQPQPVTEGLGPVAQSVLHC